MQKIFLIFLGGGLGSVARYGLSNFISKFLKTNDFPIGTFAINIIGCLLIGVFSAWFMRSESLWKYFLIAGFCGGFTTFSTFSAENYYLFQNGGVFQAIIYTVSSVIFGILAVFMGFYFVKNYF